MREILFRGKRIDNGEWLEGYYTKWSDGTASIVPPGKVMQDIIPATISQYTGWKDQGKKRIFEGDIVKAVLPVSLSQPGFTWPPMPVVFKNGVFGLLNHRGEVIALRSFAPTVIFEVIGNIHDNPELLGRCEHVKHS